MSGDPEQEYFADGVVEDIITALSRFSGWFGDGRVADQEHPEYCLSPTTRPACGSCGGFSFRAMGRWQCPGGAPRAASERHALREAVKQSSRLGHRQQLEQGCRASSVYPVRTHTPLLPWWNPIPSHLERNRFRLLNTRLFAAVRKSGYGTFRTWRDV